MRGGLRILAATALLVALPFIQAQATASNLTSLSASLSSTTVSATGVTLTLTLVTSGTIASGSDIMFTLAGSPSSFNISGVAGSNITSSTMSGSGSTTSFGDSTFLKFTPSADATAGTHTISVSNITNPSSASTGTVTLSTTGFGGFSGGATSTATVAIGSSDDTGGEDDGGFDDGGFDSEGGSVTGDNTITVTLTNEAGTALAGETVSAYCGMSYQTGTTDSVGQTTLSDLSNGNCGVGLFSSDYYTEDQNFTFAATDAAKTEDITLTATALDTNVAITVTNPDGSAADSIGIYMTDSEGREFYGTTDSSGEVEFGVFYGSYVLNGYIGGMGSSYYVPETNFTIDSSGITADGNTNEITVQLAEYTSFITTSAVDSNGAAVGDIRNLIYNADMMRFSQSTDSIAVLPGTYTVKFESDGYANTAVSNVVVGEGETVAVEATMTAADNTLNISTVDTDGNPLSVSGYMTCKDPAASYEPAYLYFDFMSEGSSSFTFPDGDFQCTAQVTGYVSDNPTFTMAGGETETGEITLTAYNATLTVTLEDQDGNALSNARFGVFGETADGQTLSGYSMGDSVEIGALAGTYTLRAYVMGGGYTSDYSNPTEITLADGDAASITLTVFETTGTISGSVTDADDNGVSGAGVKSTCTTKAGKTFEFTTTTDTAGAYAMDVVNGTCVLNSAVDDGSALPSGDESVQVSDGESVDHDLQLQDSTATLNVTPAGSSTSGIAALDVDSGSCYAYNAAGVYVTADVNTDTGKASLPVLGGDWSYGCRVVSDDKVKVSDADGTITVQKGDTKSVQATVGAADDNFTDVVAQFSATSDSTFSLPDGTEVFVPANALDNSGNVTVTASMATDVASEDDIAAGPAINLTARDSNNRQITGSFNADITIKFSYTADMLEKYGMTEDDLAGGYTYSDGALSVTDQGYTVDKESNTVTVTTDHFSTFTVAGVKATAPSKVKNLKVKKITQNSAKLTWKAPSTGEVTKYKVQLRKHGIKKTAKWTTYKKVTKTSKAIKKLLAETRYQYRVAACNGTECSAYTKWEAFKTR
ncbi:MAG: fibronectin type III domain-containing protein [Candidatus Kerfeldbacteria bacterium]|nr:fibronectin type III domain-containing protein [Candidatus Kerfeldbacteria bacterium]